jgi:hypothetical protein
MTFWLLFALVLAVPAAAGEGLSRWGLRRWPRIAVAVGALAALVLVVMLAGAVVLCGLADDPSEDCDRRAGAAPAFMLVGGLVVVALAAAALIRPSTVAFRWMLWSAPLAMFAALVIGDQIVLA